MVCLLTISQSIVSIYSSKCGWRVQNHDQNLCNVSKVANCRETNRRSYYFVVVPVSRLGCSMTILWFDAARWWWSINQQSKEHFAHGLWINSNNSYFCSVICIRSNQGNRYIKVVLSSVWFVIHGAFHWAGNSILYMNGSTLFRADWGI